MAQLTSTASVVNTGSNTMYIDFGAGDRLTIYGMGKLTAIDILDGGTSSDPTLPTATKTGTEANDVLTGQDNVNDTIDGKGGHDTLRGLSGDDTLRSGSGNDMLYGGTGNDRLEGGTGDDKLMGEAGNDRLDGGAGNDWLYGGAGNDVFAFAEGGGKDLVGDFVSGQDKIDLSAFGLGSMAKLATSATVVTTSANTMYIDFGAGDRLTLYGIGKLTADNVVF
jgi:Ca2+-binding RTX toxin-like protein